MIDQQVLLFVECGAAGTFICGTTGEGHSLTVPERMQVAERWVHAAGKSLPVIVHVGHNCRDDAVALAQHAQRIGSQAIAAVAPTYHKPDSIDELIDFCAPIAAAAPDLPFYLYDIPSMTGLDLPADKFLERAADHIDSLAGAKYSSDDLKTFLSCVRLNDGAFEVLYGCDEMLLAALALGARGAVGSTYNFAAPVYRRLIKAFDRGDLDTARREQHEAVQLIDLVIEVGVLRATKAIMSLIGVDCGPVRPPVRTMTEPELRSLYERLAHREVFPRPLRLP